LVFKSIAKFFDAWIGQVLSYAFLIVMFSAVFGLMMSIFTGYMKDVALDGEQNVAYTVGGCLILAIVMVVVLLQLPGIASSLGGGVSLGFLQELRSIRNAAGSAANAMYKSGGSGAGGSGGGSGQATGAIPAVGRAVAGAAGKAVGLFKGKKAA
jgi:type IV secretion system protein VirB6